MTLDVIGAERICITFLIVQKITLVASLQPARRRCWAGLPIKSALAALLLRGRIIYWIVTNFPCAYLMNFNNFLLLQNIVNKLLQK